jgi:hypothetical protein
MLSSMSSLGFGNTWSRWYQSLALNDANSRPWGYDQKENRVKESSRKNIVQRKALSSELYFRALGTMIGIPLASGDVAALGARGMS